MKSRNIAILFALASGLAPLSGFHKFYLGQRVWGIFYLLLSLFPPTHLIARTASLFELVWYVLQDTQAFDTNFNNLNNFNHSPHSPLDPNTMAQTPSQTSPLPSPPPAIQQTQAAVTALRDAVYQLEQLRQEGLISEGEFEEKRRVLLGKIQ